MLDQRARPRRSGAPVAALERWADRHGVECLTPGDAGFAERKLIYNRLHEAVPLALLAPSEPEQVGAALRYAAERGLPLAVRGGGHHVAGFGTRDGGVVLDLRRLSSVVLSEDRGRVAVGGGARLRDLDTVTCPAGVVVPTGTVSDTGLGGLALGGGIGWLIGLYGLTCDNLVAADVVLADGSLAHVDEASAPKLLWGLRGGGPGLAVVTRFHFRARSLPRCTVGTATVPLARSARVLRNVLAFLASSCPPELTVAPGLRRHGDDPVLDVDFCLTGEDERPLDALLDAVGPADLSMQRDASFRAWQQVTDRIAAAPLRGYWKAAYVRDLPASAADDIVAAFRAAPGESGAVLIEHLHGAFRSPGVRGAFPLRHSRFGVLFSARWADPVHDAACAAWARGAVRGLDAGLDAGSYSNYDIGDDGRVMNDFGRERDRRQALLELKRRYDPGNVLDHNHLGRSVEA